MHINQFSQETQDFIHRLCANAIMRAIKNGTYKEMSSPATKNDKENGGS